MSDYEKMPRTVIVHGGPATGKTYHGAALARALGCESVVEWDDPRDRRALKIGALHLTLNAPAPGTVPHGVLILPVAAALGAAIAMGEL